MDENGDGICDLHCYTDANYDGLCDYYTDADGDGICDTCAACLHKKENGYCVEPACTHVGECKRQEATDEGHTANGCHGRRGGHHRGHC